jgi:hypothetical protein
LTLNHQVSINANNIYKITVAEHEQQTIDIELTVEHWNDSQENVVADQNTSLINWAGATCKSSDSKFDITLDHAGIADNATFEYSITQPITLTIVTEGKNKSGGTTGGHSTILSVAPEGTWGYLQSDLDGITVSSATSTTYGISYTTTHTITLTPTDAPLETVLEIKDPANSSDVKQIHLKSINFNKLGKAVSGTVLNAKTKATGLNRWEKAIVIEADNHGMPKKVYASFGTLAVTDFTSYAQEGTANAVEALNKINTVFSAEAAALTYDIGDNFSSNFPGGTPTVLTKSQLAKAESEFPLIKSSSIVKSYKTMVINYDRTGAAPGALQFPVLAIDSNDMPIINRRTDASDIQAMYGNSLVTGFIDEDYFPTVNP